MVDTVAFRGPWPLRESLPPRRRLTRPGDDTGGTRLKIDSTGWNVEWVECSLPRLLFGHNRKLLSTQDELDAALTKLREIVSRYAEVPPFAEWQPKRLDLCWNFDLPARPLIFAHATLRMPGIRSEATLFGAGAGVSWRGAKSGFVVTLYDKARELGAEGSAIRVEISLRGTRAVGRFPTGESLKFLRLWGAFHRVLASIPAIPNPKSAPDWQTAVGMEPPEVRNRIMARLAVHPERTFRRWRKGIEAAQMPGPFCWAEFLSEDQPPEPVQFATRSRRRHR